MELKDYITIAISCLALTVAGTTAYLTFRQGDDLRASLEGHIDMRADDRRPRNPAIFVATKQRITISNLGNRAASIYKIMLLVSVPYSGKHDDDCSTSVGFELYAKPLHIKAGDIWSEELTLSETSFDAIFANANATQHTALVCVQFDFAALGDSPQRLKVRLAEGEMLRRENAFYSYRILYREGSPISLLKRNRLF